MGCTVSASTKAEGRKCFPATPLPSHKPIGGATHCELADSASGALVHLRHGGWDQFDPDGVRGIRAMLAGGWKSHVLPGLKRVAEAAGSRGS
jgi:hypothetical protein